MHNIPSAKALTPLSAPQPGEKTAIFLLLLATQKYNLSVVAEQVKKSYLSPLTGICYLTKLYGRFSPDTLTLLGLPDLPVCPSISHHASMTVKKS